VTDQTTVSALQDALDTEHRAVYGYGVAGGRLTGDALSDAQAALVVHANRRDVMTRLIRAGGATPVAAGPGYAPPHRVLSPTAAYVLAVGIEDACAASYTGIIAASRQHEVRRSAIGWLRDSATRSARWRVHGGPSSIATTPPLPGLDVARVDTVRPTPT